MDPALRELVDRQQIEDLVHDYCTHVDRYEPEKVAALFTEDCVTGYGPFGGVREGRDVLERGFGFTLAGFAATSHHVSNLRLRFEGPDVALGYAYLYAWHRYPDDRPDYEIWGRYDDRFVRQPDGWRIASPVITCRVSCLLSWAQTQR